MAKVLLILVPLLLTSVAHAQSARPITWVKWCGTGTTTVQNKEGKDARAEADICMTYHNLIAGDPSALLPGAVMFASLDEVKFDEQFKQRFRVEVRPGMSADVPMGLTLVPKDLWEKVQKDAKLEENDKARMDTLTFNLDLALCRPEACTAQVEAMPAFLANLEGSGGFIVVATGESGALLVSSVALAGFAEALVGEPYNWRELLRTRERIPQGKVMRCDEGDWPGCKLP